MRQDAVSGGGSFRPRMMRERAEQRMDLERGRERRITLDCSALEEKIRETRDPRFKRHLRDLARERGCGHKRRQPRRPRDFGDEG